MKIRSITYFCNPGWPLEDARIEHAAKFLSEARAAYEAAGFEVQSTRLATLPFLQILGVDRIAETPRLAEKMAAAIQAIGIAYASLGPAQPEVLESYAVIPEAIAAAQTIFFSGAMADTRFGISLPAVQACAEVITRCAPVTPDGFANLRFAALANVKAGSPFFPAAYRDQDEPAFIVPIGDMSRPQGKTDEHDRFDQPDEAQREGIFGELVDLPGNDQGLHLGRERREEAREQEKPVVADLEDGEAVGKTVFSGGQG